MSILRVFEKSLRSNSVTRQINFKRTKICGNAKIAKFKCDILSNFQTMCLGVRSTLGLEKVSTKIFIKRIALLIVIQFRERKKPEVSYDFWFSPDDLHTIGFDMVH